jgi:hypothetical protein
LIINGATSGATTFQAAATTTSVTYTLPSAAPATSGYVLSATTGGVMSWITNESSPSGSTKSAAYTLVAADDVILWNSTTAVLTVDPTTMTAYKRYVVKQIAATPTTAGITPASGTIDGAATFVFTSQYDSVNIFSDGTNIFIV